MNTSSDARSESEIIRPNIWHAVTDEDYVLRPGEQICYTETDTPFIPEHQALYNELFQFVQDLISGAEPWEYKPDEESDEEIPVPREYKEYLKVYAHKRNIARHLKGMDYDMDRARPSFKAMVTFRIKERLDLLSYEDFRAVLDYALVYCTFCRDKIGHPVAYFRFPETALDTDAWDEVHRSFIFAAEKAGELSGERNLFKTIWIFDLGNLGYSTIPPYAMIKDMIHLWTTYYPETLYKCFIVNAPWAFQAVWAFVAQFLTENTKAKIMVLDAAQLESGDVIGEHIAPDSLHVDYGGNWNEIYSFHFEEQGQKARRDAKMQETVHAVES